MSVFTKKLTATDVERRLSFPEERLPALLPFDGCEAVALLVKDDVGVLWNFVCTIKSGASRRLVILSGWIQFVQSRHLQKGDSVIFYKEDDVISGAHYKIEVERSGDSLTSVNTKQDWGSH